MNKELAIFGPYPPPLGGISVHVKRIEPFLNESKIPYQIYNHGYQEQKNVLATKKNLFWYIKLLFTKRYGLFHFHQFFFFHFLYYPLFSLFRREKVFVTIHSERILGYHKIVRSLVLLLLAVTRKTTFISVSKNLNDYLNEKGVSSIFLPAYVPPTVIADKKINSTKEIFLFSVWKFNQKLSNEIYNVPLTFQFLSENKDKFTMLFMIGSQSDSDVEYLEELMQKYDVTENIEVVFNENLVDYVKNCKFLLRPNLSDGYGVSIQEAMDLGIPAIASDVCERPKGTILFKSDDIEDLSKSVSYVMNTSKDKILNKKENLIYHNQLIDMYVKILKDETGNTEF
ncbi:glycosyltransferase [Aquimarina spongiae]|uniref:Glycosyltransferase involved in cell wall bisynthesis n=1 Tax=Aquimarina spongiae TaxID=570521 RepID=A0A1M6FA21_9FLAO|nr:glycosyltransferase [Aquimarina spongiae]SHI94513.1 Glycosyltransferase involved in cell wall bisynthesis [Aquimarina spongiae]